MKKPKLAFAEPEEPSAPAEIHAKRCRKRTAFHFYVVLP